MLLQPETQRSAAENQMGLGRVLALTVSSCIIAVILAEVYSLGRYLALGPWQGALAIHVFFSLGILYFFFRNGVLRRKAAFLAFSPRAPLWFRRRPWLAYAPAAVLVCGSVALVLISRDWEATGVRAKVATPWAWIFWVPFFEEFFLIILFRRTGSF